MNYIDNWKTIELSCSQKYKIQGYSKAGKMTGFWVHGLKIILDAGIPMRRQPNAVFITHSHTDHSQMLPNIITCREKLTPIFMPISMYEPMKLLQQSIKALSDGYITNTKMDFYALQKNDVKCVKPFDIINDICNMEVQILPCYHTCDSVGYGFSMVSQKLKPEYIETIKTIKDKKNDNLYYRHVTPQFVFFGDTNINALKNHSEWISYPSIIIECTGYLPEDADNYYKIGHIHINDIIPYMKLHSDKQFILIHSSESSSDEFLQITEKHLQENVNKNIIISK